MNIKNLTVTELLNLMGFARMELQGIAKAAIPTPELDRHRTRYNVLFERCKIELDSRVDEMLTQ